MKIGESVGHANLTINTTGNGNMPTRTSSEPPSPIDPNTRRFRVPANGTLWWVSILAIAVIIGLGMFVYSGAQDSDMWWLFATGREIVSNGIPYTNPFSVYPDQAIVVQQWIPAVLDWIIYDTFGYIGIGLFVFSTTMALAVTAFWVSRIVMNGIGGEIAWCLVAVLIGLCSSYLSIRPQVWSMIAFLLVIGIMEKYRRGENRLVLGFLPIIVCLHANFHMSMMPFDFVIVAAYIIPWRKISAIQPRDNGYNRLPIMIAFIVMVAASLVNPYGIDGTLYLLSSLGSAEYGNYISEMGTISPWDSYYGILMMVMVIIGAMGIGRNGLKPDVPLSLLYLFCAFLSIQHVRNVWLVGIFAFVLFCSSIRGARIAPTIIALRDDTIKIILAEVCCVVIFALGLNMTTDALVKEPQDSKTTPVIAVEYLEEQNLDKESASVFTFFNAGGFLEFHGYRVSMDARPELWDSKIAKNGEDRYHEYIDLTKGDISPSDFLANKDFDYFVANTDTELYKFLLKSTEYRQATSGNGYVLFERA